MYEAPYNKKKLSYFKETSDRDEYSYCSDCSDTAWTPAPGPVPRLDGFDNHLGLLLGVSFVVMVAVAVFGLMPVLGALMLAVMGTLIFGMVGCLGFMGRY